MQRKCVCGNYIAGKRHICPVCESVYGERSEWPEWLRIQVNETENEYRYQIMIDKHEIPFALLERGDDEDFDCDYIDEEEILDTLYPYDHLVGCRTETHLYEDRDKYPPSNGLINSYKRK